jgi:hypothetical protein
MSYFDKVWYLNYGNGSSTGYYAVAQWAASTAYSAGQFVRQLATPTVGNERCFVCITAGTSSGSEPSWTLTRGAKTTDNTATWQECTGMPGTNGDTADAVTWAASTSYSIGEVIYDSVTASLQIASTAGTSKSGSAPSFSATAGMTTADNTVTWTSLGSASNFSPFQNPHARLNNAFSSGWGVAGNTFYVASAHAESQSGSINNNSPGTQTNPCSVICGTTATAPPTTAATSASISSAAGINNNGVAYCYGVHFQVTGSSSASIALLDSGSSSGACWVYESCTIDLSNNTNTSTVIQAYDSYFGSVICNFCTFLFNNTSQNIQAQSLQPSMMFRGCAFASSGAAPSSLFSTNANGSLMLSIIDSDLSAITGNVISVSSIAGYDVIIENCKLNSGATIVTGSIASLWNNVRVHNCDSGATNYKFVSQTYLGSVQASAATYRSGGATNGTTPVCFEVISSSKASLGIPYSTQAPFGEEIAQWNSLTGSPLTATIYLTSNAALTNAQFWVELEYLGSPGSPLGSLVNSRVALLGTPSALTTDSSSTWVSGGSNNYKVAVSFTPQLAGPVKAKLYLAAPSATVYVDPNIYIGSQAISRSELIPGCGYMNETAVSSGGSYTFG